MKKRRRKIFIVCSTLILILLLNVNVFALPPSVSNRFDPFNVLVAPYSGYFQTFIEGGTEAAFGDDLSVVSSLPNFYYNTENLQQYSDDVVSRYEILEERLSFYSESDNISSAYISALDSAVLTYDYTVRLSPVTVAPFFTTGCSFYLKNAYLSPYVNCYDVENNQSLGGVSFYVLDPDTQDIDFDWSISSEFLISGLDRTFHSYYSGSAASYYDTLLWSDVPWGDYAEEYDQSFTDSEFLTLIDYFREKYDSLLFVNDSQDANTLSNMFDWCGALYGTFEVGYDLDASLQLKQFNCTVKSALVDDNTFRDFFEDSVQRSVYRGLTGFERTTKFLGSAVSGFLNLEIMPNFSMSGLLIVIISFSVVLWWLKVYAGG